MTTDKRETLLDAAERAILAEGFAGASTRRIAEEAGVPLSLVHYHFGGKEGLLVALVERTRQRNRTAARGAARDDGTATARAGAALEAARHAIAGGDTGIRLIVEMTVAALHNARLRAEVERLYAETVTALNRSVEDVLAESGRSPGDGARTRATASLMLAAGLGLALQRMLGAEEETIEEAFDVFGHLLRNCYEREAGRTV
jgi:AcrR family transcriptional regulator